VTNLQYPINGEGVYRNPGIVNQEWWAANLAKPTIVARIEVTTGTIAMEAQNV